MPLVLSATLAERYWSKVDVRGPEECWPWLASRQYFGHGALYVGRRDCVGVVWTAHAFDRQLVPPRTRTTL